MSTDNEQFVAEMWKAKITAAVETHNSGLHDGYQLGWSAGFKAGMTVSRATALLEHHTAAPVRRAQPKKNRRPRTQKYSRARTRA